MCVDLFAKFCRRLIVPEHPFLDVLHHSRGIFSLVEGVFHAKGFVELVEDLVLVLRAEYLADFISGVVVGKSKVNVVELLWVLTIVHHQHFLEFLLLRSQSLQVFLYLFGPHICDLLLEQSNVLFVQVLVAENEGKERSVIFFCLHFYRLYILLHVLSKVFLQP